MTTQDYRQFSSDSSLHTKQKKRTFIICLVATVKFHLIEWFVDVLMSFQVLPTTPHNVGILLRILGHELTGCQISKHIHLHTTREVLAHTARIPDFQPGRQHGKESRHQQRELRTSKEYAVPLVTRDAFQLTRFYIEHFRQ